MMRHSRPRFSLILLLAIAATGCSRDVNFKDLGPAEQSRAIEAEAATLLVLIDRPTLLRDDHEDLGRPVAPGPRAVPGTGRDRTMFVAFDDRTAKQRAQALTRVRAIFPTVGEEPELPQPEQPFTAFVKIWRLGPFDATVFASLSHGGSSGGVVMECQLGRRAGRWAVKSVRVIGYVD